MIFLFFLLPITSIFGLQFHDTDATLSAIERTICSEQKGAYLRFGDGDILVMNGIRNDSHQTLNSKLQIELQEAIQLTGDNVFKTLPLYHKAFGGFEEGMFPGNHETSSEFCENMIHLAECYWHSIDKVYSHAALSFAATQYTDRCINFLITLKRAKPKILIGNKYIPRALIDLLFGTQCIFIPSPESNAYSYINDIENACNQILKEDSDYSIVVVAMGLSGRALEKRLYKNHDNLFLFDFGSLMDALIEAWKFSHNTEKRAWIELCQFDPVQFLDKLKQHF